MKKIIVDLLIEALKSYSKERKKLELEALEIPKSEVLEKFLEVPKSTDMGDYAFPCFIFAKQVKESPHDIALRLREKMGEFSETDFDSIEIVGPYINFFVNRKSLVRETVQEILKNKEKYGKNDSGKKDLVAIEFSSPNIAKPFHIGHLRSTIIGNSLANISEFNGYKVQRINYLGDFGTQFGKLIFGFQKFGSEKKLAKDPVKHLLDIYVKVSKNEDYDGPSREWFKKLEEGDKVALKFWKNFKKLSLEDFDKIYERLGIQFDEFSAESKSTKGVPEIVKRLEKKKLLKKSKGAMIVDLKEFNLGVCLITKSDGASTYAARDLAEVVSRYEKHKFSRCIYEVGQEQLLHFKQIFKILELLGYKWAKDLLHVDHGFYLGENGKKFATRKGALVYLTDILDETEKLAFKEIKKRFPNLAKVKVEERAKKIAIAAIFYGDLKNTRTNNVVFDLKKFVSFEGDTGPYLEYSYARASSILKKVERESSFKIEELEDSEFELGNKLKQFPKIVEDSYSHLKPELIAKYSYELAQIFNEFYHACPVLGSDQEQFRLALVESFRQVLMNACNLLGIDVIEEM